MDGFFGPLGYGLRFGFRLPGLGCWGGVVASGLWCLGFWGFGVVGLGVFWGLGFWGLGFRVVTD